MGFGANRVQGIPKAPGGTVGPPWLLPGKVCPGNSFLCPEPGKEQPPPHSAPTHGQVPSPSCWYRGHPLCQQQSCPRAPQSTPVTFLKDIWCHQVVGTQVSPGAAPRQGTDHGRTAGRHKDWHRALVQAGQCPHPTRSISVLLQPPAGLLLYIAHSEGPSGPQSQS